MDSTMLMLLGVLASVLCVASAVLLVVVAVVYSRRPKAPQAAPPKVALRPAPAPVSPIDMPLSDDGPVDHDEPVIVKPPAPAPTNNAAARRSAGATIIAFDEPDDEDDDGK
jgi:hypothetical protein